MVKKMEGNIRLPHVGWNEINIESDNKILKNIPNNGDMYFVHSYAFEPQNTDHVITTTTYGTKFTSAINKGNIFGVQFHPEKSQKLGCILLKNFLEI